jgi:aryl-alcohol dehydrogenase-like predicted oxidoreductase
VLSRGDDIVPIPGTKRRKWLDANLAALDVQLDDAEQLALEQAFPPGVTAGRRYPGEQMGRINL